MASQDAANILVVDDEPYVADLIQRILTAEGYSCTKALSGEAAVQVLEDGNKFHLVVTDIMMPGMSGLDLLEYVKASFPATAVLMVSGVDDRRTAVNALERGAYGYLLKPFERNEIVINIAGALERRRLTLLSKQHEEALEAKVRQRTLEVRQRESEIVLRLISASEHRDDETGCHVRRVGLYAAELAAALGWVDARVDDIRLAAPMHDIGKIGIPDRILLKPGKLTPAEFETMKQHTIIGAKILDGTDIPLLEMAKEIALGHHEKWDGSGYPYGLIGNQVPESALIVGMADFYDALVHDRVYRPAMPEEKALSIITACGRDHFGKDIFNCFMSTLPNLRLIRQQEYTSCEDPTPHRLIGGHSALSVEGRRAS
ncbi:MAG: response regulator [Desulfomonilaceae bacterium]|nr:response regulator [Desulfomonilaceae bacterium]